MLVRPDGTLSELSDLNEHVSNWAYLDDTRFTKAVTVVTYRCAESYRGLTVPF